MRLLEKEAYKMKRVKNKKFNLSIEIYGDKNSLKIEVKKTSN